MTVTWKTASLKASPATPASAGRSTPGRKRDAMRMVTAVAPSSARGAHQQRPKPHPQDKIAECMDEINALRLRMPICWAMSSKNVAGTGVNLVATHTLV